MSLHLGAGRGRQLGAVVGVAAVIAVVISYVGGGLFHSGSGHTITAVFSDAQFIDTGNTVHVDGVTGGTVTKITLDHNKAYLTLHLDDGFWPIHTDATADVRPVSLLGEDYVDLNPGSAAKPVLPNGGIIKATNTTNATNLQSVLDTFNDPTSTALSVLISSLGQGLAGQGADASDAIKALAPALTDTNQLVGLLSQQNQLLTSVIDQVQPVTSALGVHQGKTLDDLVGTTDQLLGATAASQQALGSDLQKLPGFLAATTSSFDQLGGLADQATPALASITPITGSLPAITDELTNFADAAQPAAADLQPVLVAAHGVVTQASPVVTDLQAAGPATEADAASLVPITNSLVGTCNGTDCTGLDNLFGFLRGWSLSTQNYDGLSHYFNFFTDVGDSVGQLNTVVGGLTGTPVTAASTATPASTAPPAATAAPVAVPSATNPLSGVGSAVGGVTNTVGGVVNNLLGGGSTASSSSSASPSATGLSPGQEQSLLGYLLGGG
jgi:phospholipid/cholesterol/gamma-HCH transport system substrate-binding protein